MAEFTSIIQHPDSGWLAFAGPRAVIATTDPARVMDALGQVELATADGSYAVGFVTYDAASAFDSALTVPPRAPTDPLPLLWFALFDHAHPLPRLPPPSGTCAIGTWTPSVSEARYHDDMARIRRWIAAGDTYQVNYTLRMNAIFTGDPYALFHRLAGHQMGSCQAWIDTGRFAVCSASPELFLQRTGAQLLARPMKGTISRAPDSGRDQRQARRLARSAKDRAENVMIVDMIRNDLGRIAQPGTVRPQPLFEIEAYPTLYQMTSTVTAQSTAPLTEVFRTMFPCASITGAPKVRTMQLIRELETRPRGLYTGAIGVIHPGGDCVFNVAIRTAVADRALGTLEYGVGSGIVWDSDPVSEYQECLLKTAILTCDTPVFDLLETLLWQPPEGYALLEEHLDRLCRSAAYFAIPVTTGQVRTELLARAETFGNGPDQRVRLTVSPQGEIRIAHSAMAPALPDQPIPVSWARQPVDPADPFLYHKTTNRHCYEAAAASTGYTDGEVLLWNARGEVTEAATANVVVLRNGRLFTPPVTCGLLAGTLREALLKRRVIRERRLTREILREADAFWLINSVRGWRRGHLR